MKKPILLTAMVMLLCGGTVVQTRVPAIRKDPSAVNKLKSIANTMDSTANDLDRSSQMIKNLSK